MKRENTVFRSDDVAFEVSQLCCLARVNAVLKTIRAKHDRAAAARLLSRARHGQASDDDLHAPSPRDFDLAELEASVAPETCIKRVPIEGVAVYDSPQEIARAGLVFAATLVVPLLLIAAGLTLFDGSLGRAATSLLQFSALTLATPLILALSKTALQSGWQGVRRHPVLASAGAVAAGGYAASAYAMSMQGNGTAVALTLSMVGLLVMAVQLGHWHLVRNRPV